MLPVSEGSVISNINIITLSCSLFHTRKALTTVLVRFLVSQLAQVGGNARERALHSFFYLKQALQPVAGLVPQHPVRPAFAMTINKSQGQTL